MFSFAPQLAERMRDFRLERIARIAAGDAPVSLLDDCCLVLHVIPFSHFDLRPMLSLTDAANPQYFPPLGMRSANDWRINFDGFLSLSNEDARATGQRAYVQVFRSGAVEAVASSIARSDRNIDILTLTGYLVKYTMLYTTDLRACGAAPPFAVLASVIGVKGRGILTGVDTIRGMDGEYSDRDQLHLSEVILETVPTQQKECATLLRPVLDQLANAAGTPSSPSFNHNGIYVLL